MTQVVDIRTYKLVPGGRDEFDRIFRAGAAPMLRRHGIEVVGHGPSIADENHYYLMRSFPSLAERARQLESFYGSDEWRENYDPVVSPLIETYHTVVLEQPPWTGDDFQPRNES